MLEYASDIQCYCRSIISIDTGKGINNNSSVQLIRRRKNQGYDMESVHYSSGGGGTRRARRTTGQGMPYYTALVTTGAPIAQYNYMNLIHVSLSFLRVLYMRNTNMVWCDH